MIQSSLFLSIMLAYFILVLTPTLDQMVQNTFATLLVDTVSPITIAILLLTNAKSKELEAHQENEPWFQSLFETPLGRQQTIEIPSQIFQIEFPRQNGSAEPDW